MGCQKLAGFRSDGNVLTGQVESHPFRERCIEEGGPYHSFCVDLPAPPSPLFGFPQTLKRFVCLCGDQQPVHDHGELRQCSCGIVTSVLGNGIKWGVVPGASPKRVAWGTA